MPITTNNVLKVKINGEWVQIPSITNGGGTDKNAIRYVDTFESIQDAQDVLTEIASMSDAERADFAGSYWYIPGGIIAGFDKDTYIWYPESVDYEHALALKPLGIHKENLWWDPSWSGSSFPSISQYAGDVYFGRCFYRTDEKKMYMLSYLDPSTGNATWTAISNLNGTAASIASGETGYVTGDQVYQAIYAVENASY